MATIEQTNTDDITETFEIIDRDELLQETQPENSSNNDALNNNGTDESVETTTNITPQLDDDCNNNHDIPQSKRYTREQLIKIKQFDASTIIPNLKREVKNLLFTEKSELENTLSRKARTDVIAPSFMNMNANTLNRPKQRSNEGGRRSQQGNRRDGALITVRLQSNEEVVLKEAENAWKPQNMINTAAEEVPEEERKTAELLKQFRSILNKLTPENFSTLIEKLKTLQIDTVERLDNCISLVFEKAILEFNYASSYASLCKEVSDVFIVPLDPNNDQQKAVFKKRLITQCQREFEKHRDNELVKNTAVRLEAIEKEEDPIRKEEMRADFDFENMTLRKRAVGTVHFIGELYKIEMLTSKIMRSCITHLLDPSMCSEETLECLCKLLSTVGKRLEKLDKNKVDLSDYFATLEKLADKNNPIGISSRIRFMIQDIIELRLNNWTPRKLQRENKPLTMDEIKNQVILENAIKELDNKDAIRDEKVNRGRRTGAINTVNEDGWSISSYSKPRPVKFDSLKLPIANDDIKLGQPSNFTNFQNYQTNRFAGLKEEENSTDSNRNSNYNGRFSGNSFDGNKSNRNNNNNNRGSNRSAGSKSLQGGKNQNYGSNRPHNYDRNHRQSMQFLQQRPNDFPTKSSTLPRKTSAPARPMQYSDAFIQERNLTNDPNKVFDILKSSLTGFEHKEITLEEIIEKLRKYRITKDSIVLLYNWAFDQHDNERIQLTEIICEGVSRNIIMTRDLLDALKETLELAQDLACDLPLVYSYIGQFVSLPLVKRIIGFKDFLEISKPQIECKNGEKILKNVLKAMEQKFGKDSLIQVFKEANINFEAFLDTECNNWDKFLKENVSK
jgi:translation initiation factor 4G